MVSLSNNVKELGLKLVQYKLARRGLIKSPMPINLTYSITAACQSSCKSCNIGLNYRKNPKIKNEDLTLQEIERVFKSIGHTYFFNISGGEPFLREDIPQIVELSCKYLTPKVIHTPTNALAPSLIEKKTKEILEVMKEQGFGKIPFTIKPSFDGIGPKHDYIRGVKGNFEKLIDTITRLKSLQKEYPNLDVGLGTVVSKFNYQDIGEIMDYIKNLNVDSYIHEIAENRSEFFNFEDDITPSPEIYKKVSEHFINEIKTDIKNKKKLTRFTQAFRLVYYELISEMLYKKRQVIFDYSGYASAHINPQGQVWANGMIGYKMPMGNLREANYDFKQVWYSQQAEKVRSYIKKDESYYCPVANVAYTNILLSNRYMFKVFKNLIFN